VSDAETKDVLPPWLLDKMREAWADHPSSGAAIEALHERFARDVLAPLHPGADPGDCVLPARSYSPRLVALVLALFDDAREQYEAFSGLIESVALGQAVGEALPPLQEATLDRALHIVLGNAGRALLRLGGVRNGLVFRTDGKDGEACDIEIRRPGGRSLVHSLGAAQGELDALRAWVQGLRADFAGLTDNPADPTRLHDWTWVDAHRPAPVAVESGEVAKRIHAAETRALDAESAHERMRSQLENALATAKDRIAELERAKRDHESLFDLLAEIPFGHDGKRVLFLRSQDEAERVAWVDRVHETVRDRRKASGTAAAAEPADAQLVEARDEAARLREALRTIGDPASPNFAAPHKDGVLWAIRDYARRAIGAE